MKLRMVFATVMVIATACTPTEATTTSTSGGTVPSTTTTTEPALLTGVGVRSDTIRLAAFLPLSGSLSEIGSSMLEGQRAYWRYVNEDLGGVAGRFKVDVDEVDTAYDSDTAVAELLERENSILGISAMLGSLITQALLDATAEVPIVVGSQASGWGEHDNAVFDLAVPTYRDQTAVLWDRAVEAAGGSAEVGFVGVEGIYGDDCLTGAGSSPQIVVRYPAGTTDFEQVVRDLDGATALVACVTSADLVRIISTGDLLGFTPQIYATALSFDPSVLDALETVPEDLWIAGAPPPYEADTSGMELFRTITENLDSVDVWTFVGYTQAASFHLLLEKAVDDGTLTRSGMLAARSHLGDIDFGFGWGSARFDAVLPEVPVTLAVPDPDATFGLRPLEP